MGQDKGQVLRSMLGLCLPSPPSATGHAESLQLVLSLNIQRTKGSDCVLRYFIFFPFKHLQKGSTELPTIQNPKSLMELCSIGEMKNSSEEEILLLLSLLK